MILTTCSTRPLDTAPEEGEPWALIAQDYQDKILPGITHWWVCGRPVVLTRCLL